MRQSTHLVSVTLDLVVLIDRLLTLLRRRSDLLELASIRLRWDRLHHEASEASRRLAEDVYKFVTSEGRWQPDDNAMSGPQTPRRRLKDQCRDAKDSHGEHCSSSPSSVPVYNSPAANTPASRTSEVVADVLLPSTATGSSAMRRMTQSSPYRAHTKESLRVTLLHSHITNMQIRHHNLSSVLIAQSGRELDRMIDCAGAIKNTGGTIGTSEAGIVPTRLLDLQDAIEGNVQDLGKRIEWCKQLQTQWEW